MKKYIFTAVMLFGVVILSFGCGTGSEDEPLATATQPTKAVLSISTSGTLPTGAKIGGIDISVTLAPGVSLKTKDGTGETSDGVVAASGVAASNSTLIATYTAQSGTAGGTARVLIVNTAGFGAGEFVTINCDIAKGGNPRAADFGLINLKVKNLEGAEVTGLTAGFTADIK